MKKGKEYEPRDVEVRFWYKRFNLRQSKITRIFTGKMCEWLLMCSDDSARRLLLGISVKMG